MLLITHIIFALASIPLMLMAVLTKYLGLRGERFLVLGSSISLIGLLASGTTLVIVNHVPLTGACLEGTAYVTVFGIASVLYRKTAKSKAE